MSNELPQNLDEIAAYFGLSDPAVVEKDWHVVRALAVIAALDTGPIRLVFAGGTCLARAHRVIKRMSEDIDLKIVSDAPITRAKLRRLRENVTQALLGAGFAFDPANRDHVQSWNESRHTIYQLPYGTRRAEAHLRSAIKIEMGMRELYYPSLDLPVSSFVSEALKRAPEVMRIPCVSVAQTTAEKFVALTRRIGEELAAKQGERDLTLVRHVYDLHMSREHYDTEDIARLAHIVMASDAAEFGHRFPAYRDDPLRATRRAVDALTTDPHYGTSYRDFMREMVYGEQVAYGVAIKTLPRILEAITRLSALQN